MKGLDTWITEGPVVGCPECGRRHRASDVCICSELSELDEDEADEDRMLCDWCGENNNRCRCEED